VAPEVVRGRLVIEDAVVPGSLTIEDGWIAAVEPDEDDEIAAAGPYLAPGFVDVHVHGWGGHDATGDAAALSGSPLGPGVEGTQPDGVVRISRPAMAVWNQVVDPHLAFGEWTLVPPDKHRLAIRLARYCTEGPRATNEGGGP
jgi:hypothetical protein